MGSLGAGGAARLINLASQNPDTAAARAFPNAGIVMCHMGGPLGYGAYAGKKDEVFATWKASMKELAACPNVSVKLGGVMMRLAAYDYMKLPVPPISGMAMALTA